MHRGNTAATEVDASFEFGGLGGGGAASFKETVKTRFPARTTCQERVVHADLVIEYGWTFIGNSPVSYGLRFRIVEVFDRPELRDLPPSLDMCGRSTIADDQDPKLHRLLRSTDGEEVTSQIAAEISDYVSMGVDLGTTPLRMGTKFSRSTKLSWQNVATLTVGMNYLEYSPTPSNPLERCWTVTDDPLDPPT